MKRALVIFIATLCLGNTVLPARAIAASYATLYAIAGTGDGASPEAAMTYLGGFLYGTTPYGGATGNGTIFRFDPASGAKKTLYSFAGGTDGAVPIAGLLAFEGKLYGTTEYGGQNDGTIFKFDPSTGTEQVVSIFCCNGSGPTAPLINVGGTLYGTTLSSANGQGTAFSFDPATDKVGQLCNFGNSGTGLNPYGGLVSVGGMLYGTTEYGGTSGAGTLFKIDLANGTETVLYSFAGGADGANPAATMIYLKGALFGTTQNGGSSGDGTVFKFTISSGNETLLHSFAGGSDGETPFAGLYDLGGTLYGTTEFGGTGGQGTIYSINPATGAEKVEYGFDYGNDPELPVAGLTAVNGTLYGGSDFGGSNGQGSLFSFDPVKDKMSLAYNFTGSTPVELGGLVSLPGKLVLTTSNGGRVGSGSVVSINPATKAATTLFNFTGESTGAGPLAALIALSGNLYGTTVSGGEGCNGIGCGTVFKLNPANGAETVIYKFGSGSAMDGLDPWSGLTALNGFFFGTTSAGGDARACNGSGCGTVYRLDPETGAESIVYSFQGGSDGETPFLGNLLAVGGNLYGTTYVGGASGAGTLFEIDLATGVEKVLYSFTGGSDGGYPYAGLINVGGVLYGDTAYGGASGNGSVFKYDLATKTESVVYSFAGGSKDGANPSATLLLLGGQLYGSTWYGGVAGSGCGGLTCGIVFAVNPSTGAETVLHIFQGGSDGGNPLAPLIAVGGTIYGSTGSAGARGLGTVFELQP